VKLAAIALVVRRGGGDWKNREFLWD
jgi:hypothetical protein